MANVSVSGVEAIKAKLKAMGDGVPNAAAVALYEIANEVITDSVNNYVPYDQGWLANAGKVMEPVVTPRGCEITLGFTGSSVGYALAVHENPRSGKTGGKSPSGKQYQSWARRGEWKYLETPLKNASPEAAAQLRQGIDDFVADVAYQSGSVNYRPMTVRAPRPTGNDILEGP